MTRGQKKEKVLIVLPEEMAKRLRKLAQETGMPMSAIIAMALRPVLGYDIELPRYDRTRVKKREQ